MAQTAGLADLSATCTCVEQGVRRASDSGTG
jgi:hypothetical protein